MKHIGRIVAEQIKGWEHRRSREGAVKRVARGAPICLSRDIGCGGRIVARMLAERLGYSILGRDTIDYIAEDMGARRRFIDLLDEQGATGLERWLDGYLHGAPVEYDEYGRSLVKVVRAAAIQGDVILLGRGANFILGLVEAFCVRLVAPMGRRVEQLMEYESIGKAEAEKMIEYTDGERASFVQKVFHRDLNDPLSFHLTLNLTDKDFAKVVEFLLDAMRLEGFDPERGTVPAK